MADGPKPGYNEPPPPYAATQGSQGPPGFAVPPTAPTGMIRVMFAHLCLSSHRTIPLAVAIYHKSLTTLSTRC